MIANHDETNFGLLRYFLGGYRPSQTARLTMSEPRIHGASLDFQLIKTGISRMAPEILTNPLSKPPGYPTHDKSKANIRVQ